MNPLTLIMIVLTAAIVVIGIGLYLYNRDVKKCNAIAEKAESKSVPEPERSFKEQLEDETGFTITRIVPGERNGLKWAHIYFTFLCNGYVTKSACASTRTRNGCTMSHQVAKAAASMKAEAAKHKLNWDY